jgi:hypothetical protein
MPVSLLERIVAAMSGRRTQERLAEVERAVRKLGEAERDRSTVVEGRLEEIGRVLAEQPTAKDLRELRQAMRAAVPEHGSQQFVGIEQIATSGRPVLIGPWTGEVGFELLYWIPFVEWVRARWQIAPEREVVVSRGGVASWYGRAPDRYVDVLSLVGSDDFRSSVAEEKRKHRRPGAFDERVTEAVVRHRGLGEVDLLHPGLMFRAFAPYWRDDAGYALIDQFRRPRLLEAPVEALSTPLPKDYVAVRFYFSECFPATPENRLLARTVTASLAERSSVVLLNPGFAIDEHADWMPDSRDRIISIGEGLTPERNLAVQSAVIAGARAFVGTYGGYSYLAPLYKVPAVAFYSRQSFKLHHLHAAQRTFLQIGASSLMPIEVAQAGLVQAALGSLAIA